MPKLTYAQAERSIPGLSFLYGAELRAAVSVRIRKLAKAVDQHMAEYREALAELETKYGMKDPAVSQSEESKTKFTEELNELRAVEVEIEFDTLKLFDIGDAILPAATQDGLVWLIPELSLEA